MRTLTLVGGYRRSGRMHYTAPSSSTCAQCAPRDVNGKICCTRVRVRHSRSDVCFLCAYWSFSGFKFPKLKCVLESLSLKYCLCAQPFEPVAPVVCAPFVHARGASVFTETQVRAWERNFWTWLNRCLNHRANIRRYVVRDTEAL